MTLDELTGLSVDAYRIGYSGDGDIPVAMVYDLELYLRLKEAMLHGRIDSMRDKKMDN